MKKLIIIITVFIALTNVVTAQETFKKGTKLLGIGIGFNENGKPIVATYDAGIVDNLFGVNKLNLGLGGYAGLYAYNKTVTQFGGTSKTKALVIAPGLRGLLHYQFIDKLDFYFGPTIGASIQKTSTSASGMEDKNEFGVDFAWGFIGGLRYEITPNWGIFIEGGKATGNFTLGAAYKF